MAKKSFSLLLSLMIGVSACCGPQLVCAEELEGEAEVQDIVEIEYYNLDLIGGTNYQEVEDAVNAISEEEIGVHVNLHMLDFGTYLQQVGLNLSGNETMDIITFTPASPITLATMTSLNQLQDISGLLEEYGSAITDDLGDYLKGDTFDGAVYGVTVHSSFATNLYIVMRKDILEALDLVEQAENMESWSDYEAILEAVYQANQDGTLSEELRTNACVSNADTSGAIIPSGTAMTGSDLFAENYGIDTLGDANKLIATDAETDTVSAYFKSDEYYQTLERVRGWYEKGYVYKDASLTEDDGNTLLRNGVTFSYICTGNYGIETDRKKSTGYDVIAKEVASFPMGSSVSQTWGTAVPVSSQEPEAAVDFINLMFKNPDVVNLLVWGIEGRDYTLNEKNEAVPTENREYVGFNFLWGNATLSYPAEDQGEFFMEESKAADDEAEVSKYMGFTANTENIANDLTSLNNVVSKYRENLESGATSDLEGEYQAFISELEAAGLQKVVDAYQEQLNAWLEEQ